MGTEVRAPLIEGRLVFMSEWCPIRSKKGELGGTRSKPTLEFTLQVCAKRNNGWMNDVDKAALTNVLAVDGGDHGGPHDGVFHTICPAPTRSLQHAHEARRRAPQSSSVPRRPSSLNAPR
jgi:hypothetical protein